MNDFSSVAFDWNYISLLIISFVTFFCLFIFNISVYFARSVNMWRKNTTMDYDTDEICIISDEEESNWQLPQIESTRTLSFDDSDSSFSGFGPKGRSLAKDKRIIDDLEIVEEVIRDVMPGKVNRVNLLQSQQMHYREKKMGFQWLKVKKESDYAVEKAHPDIFGDPPDYERSEDLPEVPHTDTDMELDPPPYGRKRRSFATMCSSKQSHESTVSIFEVSICF